MQLELYALAAEGALLRDQAAKPLCAGYWYVREDGYKNRVQFHQLGSDGLELTESFWSHIGSKVNAQRYASVHRRERTSVS